MVTGCKDECVIYCRGGYGGYNNYGYGGYGRPRNYGSTWGWGGGGYGGGEAFK